MDIWVPKKNTLLDKYVTVNGQEGGDLETMPNDLLFHSFQPWTNARRQEKFVHLSYCAWKTRTELSHVAATLTQKKWEKEMRGLVKVKISVNIKAGTISVF